MSLQFQIEVTSRMGGDIKGNKSMWSIIPEAFKVMFIVGISSQNKYSLIGTTGTGDSALFTYFLKKIINDNREHANRHKKLVFVWDNSSIHTSKKVNDFLKKEEVSILTITPYSPWLNPVESYIGWF